MNHSSNLYCHYSDLPSPMAYVEENVKEVLLEFDIDRIIEMAWEDRTPFEAIRQQFGLSEGQVRELMKKHLRFSSYKLWRSRVESCSTKHAFQRSTHINRFRSTRQRWISSNKIAKRSGGRWTR